MRLLVTGAGGFLGRAVVAAALQRGHHVRALVRSSTPQFPPGLDTVTTDLQSSAGLADALCGVEVVIHLVGGELAATRNLIDAMARAGVPSIVHVSSLSVYDYLVLPSWSILDESSPLDDAMIDRDDYARAKLVQEQLIRGRSAELGWRWTVIRPGAIFGPGRLFNARIGFVVGNCWVRTGGHAPVPLTYVENCADAIILAAEQQQEGGQIFNVVDDQLPSQRSYARLIAQRTAPPPLIIPIPWTLLRCAARLAWLIGRAVPGLGRKLPGLLSPARLHARCKPLRYSNARVKSILGWSPRYTLIEALDHSVSAVRAAVPAPTSTRGAA